MFCVIVYLSVCFRCVENSTTNEQIFIKIGGKDLEEVTNFWERSGSYFGYKKS